MLTEEEIGAFARDGFVAVRGAVTAGLARECQAAVWGELESQGVLRDDPATWTTPVVRISCPEGGPFAVAGTVPRLWEAYDQLIGAGRWWRRHGVGGTIPVRFPSEADPGDAGWHIESSYRADDQWRVNVGSRERGLLAIFLLTDADSGSAPTRLRPGSHLDVPAVLAPAADSGLPGHEAAVRAAAASAHRPAVLATGRAGDVFLCHPFLVHAASWPHRGKFPRMIAQPAVTLLGQYALAPRPGERPSPVEQAILDGLAQTQMRHGSTRDAITGSATPAPPYGPIWMPRSCRSSDMGAASMSYPRSRSGAARRNRRVAQVVSCSISRLMGK